MKNFKTLLLGGILIAATSCSSIRPYTATNNSIGEEVGKSKTTLIFGRSSGDNLQSGFSTNKKFGVIEAAKKGGIEKIGCVDVKTTNYVIFQKVEIIVRGTSAE